MNATITLFPPPLKWYIGIPLEKLRNLQFQNLNMNNYFCPHDLPRKDIYLLPRSVTLDSKMREFQYKVLSRILYANKALHKMGIVNLPACTFCQVSDESLEHLFLHRIKCFLAFCR